MRDILFISHANPEDNEFTRWLALQLAKQGYPVRCDLTKLLGGEDFWADIERAIRDRTVKFLYVLSRTSNSKRGPLLELQVAENVMRDHALHDFIIPLLIDDLPPREINIHLASTNAILYRDSWSKGLKTLLEKLELETISKSSNFTPNAVASWWRTQFGAEDTIKTEPEDYLANWFPIEGLPEKIYFHTLKRTQIGRISLPNVLPFAGIQVGQYLLSFANADDFANELGLFTVIADTNYFLTQDFLDRKVDRKFADPRQARDLICRLLRIGWEQIANSSGLTPFRMASKNLSSHFIKDLVNKDTIYFKGVNGSTSHRGVVGYHTITHFKTKTKSLRYWHFGIEAKPIVYPALAYIIKPHVVFSDDGKQIWDDPLRMHRARRSQCKNWWNADWRDRLLASMSWLANDEGKIQVLLGSDVGLTVSSWPVSFQSPVSYEARIMSEVESDYEFQDDEDEESGDDDTVEDFEAGEVE